MNAIETRALTKYYGKSRGMVDVDLTVKEGDIFGFIGPNGAGKSTMIRTLLNFIFPTSGTAKVLGLDAIKETKKIKGQVGYLPGEVDYYDDMSAGELLHYSGRFYKKDYTKNLEELVELFDLDIKKSIHSLSLGNKKKVAIIQALLHEPKLLILDEPTGGLDPLMQKRFFTRLQEENKKGTTIFFSSHVLSEVQRLCHRVAIIKEGRILKVEDMDALRNNQFRNVRINFAETIPKLNIPGILNSHQENRTLHLFFNGDVNQLVRELGRYQLNGLWLEEPTLDEVFMHYYEKEEY
ncbi:ABC transporter ATP-binding protein [Candidatus Contubernalis alkaliaceticus]|uniref:ABC transporter ATP-binding protein n=1 Tax=Candidatus Contubernalis alkaliaceticus TaxID=338645 RepID=UPI001F4BFCAD|nr:ABC transporter ATP-binding protein [Candidatus Contubernalis alkalaceticus]UNC92284.1 ABC transporter ATP-binding protein [Candidatus Contubernalis alkalaceticus]